MKRKDVKGEKNVHIYRDPRIKLETKSTNEGESPLNLSLKDTNTARPSLSKHYIPYNSG